MNKAKPKKSNEINMGKQIQHQNNKNKNSKGNMNQDDAMFNEDQRLL